MFVLRPPRVLNTSPTSDATTGGLIVPLTDEGGNPRRSRLPKTLQRSSDKAQRTFAETHDSAADEYHSQKRAYKVAYASLKKKFKKAGDRWVRRSGK
jgi:cation transport regulator ChaB